jgi:hypothetical protein
MGRLEDRKEKRKADKIINSAKKDMMEWVQKIERQPNPEEYRAWQDGYLAGISRLRKMVSNDD